MIFWFFVSHIECELNVRSLKFVLMMSVLEFSLQQELQSFHKYNVHLKSQASYTNDRLYLLSESLFI
jgi:hypothetical protein